MKTFEELYHGFVVRERPMFTNLGVHGNYVWGFGWCARRRDALLFTKQGAVDYINESGRDDLIIEPADTTTTPP